MTYRSLVCEASDADNLATQVEEVCAYYAQRGWRVVSVVPAGVRQIWYGHQLISVLILFERQYAAP